jgi:hypothetical protein
MMIMIMLRLCLKVSHLFLQRGIIKISCVNSYVVLTDEKRQIYSSFKNFSVCLLFQERKYLQIWNLASTVPYIAKSEIHKYISQNQSLKNPGWAVLKPAGVGIEVLTVWSTALPLAACCVYQEHKLTVVANTPTCISEDEECINL